MVISALLPAGKTPPAQESSVAECKGTLGASLVTGTECSVHTLGEKSNCSGLLTAREELLIAFPAPSNSLERQWKG